MKKPTHKLTYTPEKYEYEFSVDGNTYWYRDIREDHWDGPITGFDVFLNNKDWIVKKLSTFKGNK